MIEVLAGLSITLIILVSLSLIVSTLTYKPVSYNEDVYIAIKQISQYVLTKELILEDECISFDDHKIYLDNYKIIKTPGYETLLFDVDELQFYQEDEKIYILITRDDDVFKGIIGYVYEE